MGGVSIPHQFPPLLWAIALWHGFTFVCYLSSSHKHQEKTSHLFVLFARHPDGSFVTWSKLPPQCSVNKVPLSTPFILSIASVWLHPLISSLSPQTRPSWPSIHLLPPRAPSLLPPPGRKPAVENSIHSSYSPSCPSLTAFHSKSKQQ